jgi:hypothetical protein
LIAASLLNNQLVQTQVLCCALNHPFLYTVLRDERKDIDLLRLSNLMGAVRGLQIGLLVLKR